MGQKEKLIERLKSRPRDMTLDEVETLLKYFGYRLSNKGRSSGSRIEFICEGHRSIVMHRPHPRKELLRYQIDDMIQILEQEGLL